MFLHLSVIHSVHGVGGVQSLAGGNVLSRGSLKGVPLYFMKGGPCRLLVWSSSVASWLKGVSVKGGGSVRGKILLRWTNGWYASYWNAFLLLTKFVHRIVSEHTHCCLVCDYIYSPNCYFKNPTHIRE